MSSADNFNSPVTPIAMVSSSQGALSKLFKRSFNDKTSFSEYIPLGGGEDFKLPALSSRQLNFCKEALKKLKLKKGDVREKPIDREFDALEVQTLRSHGLLGRTKAAQLSMNLHKNRYQNILPFDDTRVVLNVPTRGTDKASDYINANYLVEPSNDELPAFIATQGPLRCTVTDFWEMVCQQQCPIIVMLTNLFDGNQEKCAPYFPTQAQKHQAYGKWRVSLKSLNYSQHSIATRILELQSSESPHVSHTVLHVEYLHWPDFKVPSSTRPIRELFRCLLNVPVGAGPFVVHCSAGVGRTGTYCTIDHTLRRLFAEDESAIDILSTVRRFREQRIGIVQTREQYHFCYDAVIDELEELLELQKLY